MLRKLLTKPIWWWERGRSYPIRLRYDQLPPLPVKQGRVRFVVLATSGQMVDALWSAWSWYRFLRDENVELRIAVDGAISKAQAAAVTRLFPGIVMESTDSACRHICAMAPEIKTFLYDYPTGRKLALLLALSGQGPVLYSDYDVLAFRTPHELLECIRRNAACYFAEESDGTRDQAVVEIGQSLGLEYIQRFNSGFMYIPQDALPIHLAVAILATWRPPGTSWYAEQTVLSFIMRKAHAEALPQSRYVISNQRQFYWEKDVDYQAIAARHFTGTVRHVLYKYGMPIVLEQSKNSYIADESVKGQSR
jgi:hypothetical protein